ncbi:hypothetical protein CHGG_03004 [Chaetomium globosum CBS 148.51]|uniref:Uncharacterized protein n=1 Tax=Chaetomium globosum (strain ATCC 6205 / CBS 148.51 / DSM 1962 / NBRC 6347 / NRRL 1970) TaxID=306901 RepID=Q2H9V0_CHAGB|nr:uncharacterized protein CHGG_03004 [Chaetomium globosum CBS 148.51]EAQ91069.1 hypothetical protein CHGG_03004 [Chaetomium globosum CBS 148.51]
MSQRRQPDNKAPQDVVLPTPFLRRVRNHQLSSPAQARDKPIQPEPPSANGRCTHSRNGCKTKCAFEAELASFRSITDSERHGLYESVFKAFDALLRATSPRRNQAAGPKSLLAMCLRKVPAYIAGLEEWERRESEENGTKSGVRGAGVSFEIYSELESLGAVDGWNHLCLLLRAHAVEMIQDAATEDLLEDPVTGLLIRLCLEYMPPTEFTGLIDTFVIRQYPKPSSADEDLFASPALQPLRTLRSCDPSGISTLPRILAKLLADDLLPASWVLNKSFIALWPEAVRHITHTKSCQNTLDFVVVTLELLCTLASPRKPRGVPQTRLRGKSQTTLISTIAALGSVILLGVEGCIQTPETASFTRAATLRRRITNITTACSANLKNRKTPSRKLGTYILALCAFLSTSDPPSTPSPSAPTIEAAWKNVQTCRGNPALLLQYDATTALMSTMAWHCSRGTGLPPHFYLAQFCDRLEALALPPGALANMRVDGAFRLAENTGDLRDLEVAEGLLRARQAEAAVGGCVTPGRGGGWVGVEQKGKGKVASFSGVRWDDGISEWVAATPGTEVRPAGGERRLRSSGVALSEDEAAEGDTGDDASEPESDMEADEDDVDVELVSSPEGDETDRSVSMSETDHDDAAPSPNTETSLIQTWTHPTHIPTTPTPATATITPPARCSPPPRPAPPTPAGGFLAARPRRLLLTRPLSRAGDELAFDNGTGEKREDGEGGSGGNGSGSNWLRRKKPARFRPQATAGGRGGAVAGTTVTTAAAAVVRKRVARASLVYLQPVRAGQRRRSEGWGVGGEEGEGSDDELSLL